MSSELYEDIVGGSGPALPHTYDTCQHVACPRCGAEPYAACRNSVRAQANKSAKSPCLVRMALGEGWAHRVTHAVVSTGQ